MSRRNRGRRRSEVLDEFFAARKALLQISVQRLEQHLFDRFSQVRTELAWQRQWLGGYLNEGRLRGIGQEWNNTNEQLIRHDPERVQICGWTWPPTLGLLGRHVRGCSGQLVHGQGEPRGTAVDVVRGIIGAEHAGKSKVTD